MYQSWKLREEEEEMSSTTHTLEGEEPFGEAPRFEGRRQECR